MVKVGIIDCGISNISSVRNALVRIGSDVGVAAEPEDLKEFSHVILPGVGSFAAGAAKLRHAGLDEAVRGFVKSGGFLIGICLGMQLLAQEGEEFGPTEGLGLLPGKVTRLKPSNPGLRLPHIGWNEVAFRGNARLARGLGSGAAFYFVHSYGYENGGALEVTGTCDYGGAVVAMVERDNVCGVQFHPEKSQKAGLTLLAAFTSLC